ncbi:TIGR00269 family protein [Candidatus Nanohalobium constans]|uniref:tRNA(Ile)-lysidine synthase TilS/MesJ n=1 Tax=Candidatus Nanohalobium constans TaxID=2565781 RepID=A0A5Q0UHQ2_9ARCH|nr:TIGR00269 family protein [Candidatus Nanohalobium constans]QGA80465.1 tRNA(Ile)-lysidine synthase TilS/MesJ [Candidatus Nanohalobium constans]
MTDSKCSRCDEDAVITREFEGRSLCKEHFTIDINKTVKKTIRDGNLVESGDTIAVGLSGGKDSAVMLQQLVEIFGKRPDIEIVGVCVHEGIDPYRDESISAAEELCDDLGVECYIGSYDDYYDLKMDDVADAGEKGNCTYCGIMRRDLLNKLCREVDADKMAIGHNLDDEAQSIMMNHIKGDMKRLARIGPKDDPANHEMFVERIKPLRDVMEREVALFSRLHDLGVIDRCPHVQEGSLRPMVKSFLNKLESEMPGIKYSIVSQGREISDMVEDNMDWEGEENEIQECERCGEPCSSDVCRKCQLLVEIKDAAAESSEHDFER